LQTAGEATDLAAGIAVVIDAMAYVYSGIRPAASKLAFASCATTGAGAAGGRICARAPAHSGGAVLMPPGGHVRAHRVALLHVRKSKGARPRPPTS
jgi:hypothetical protein